MSPTARHIDSVDNSSLQHHGRLLPQLASLRSSSAARLRSLTLNASDTSVAALQQCAVAVQLATALTHSSLDFPYMV